MQAEEGKQVQIEIEGKRLKFSSWLGCEEASGEREETQIQREKVEVCIWKPLEPRRNQR